MQRFLTGILLLCLLPAVLQAQVFKKDQPFAHTFSIVARDAVTGDMAVGVQSHWFSVGSLVSWGEAGVGVIATQSFVNPSFGPKGLQLLKEGKTAQEALDILLKADSGREVRQVAILDAQGRAATHTGKNCIDYANHINGVNFSVQSNMMLGDQVSKAMAASFQSSSGKPLAERVLAAMQAAQAAGGDIRGQQSAVLLVFSGTNTGQLWVDKKIDLRVDDHPAPIKELARLLQTFRAYEHMNNGDLAVEKGDMNKAMEEYKAAEKMFPHNLEMQYWHAITMANNKDVKGAAVLLKKIFAKDRNWKELTRRLPKVGLLNVDDASLQFLLNL